MTITNAGLRKIAESLKPIYVMWSEQDHSWVWGYEKDLDKMDPIEPQDWSDNEWLYDIRNPRLSEDEIISLVKLDPLFDTNQEFYRFEVDTTNAPKKHPYDDGFFDD